MPYIGQFDTATLANAAPSQMRYRPLAPRAFAVVSIAFAAAVIAVALVGPGQMLSVRYGYAILKAPLLQPGASADKLELKHINGSDVPLEQDAQTLAQQAVRHAQHILCGFGLVIVGFGLIGFGQLRFRTWARRCAVAWGLAAALFSIFAAFVMLPAALHSMRELCFLAPGRICRYAGTCLPLPAYAHLAFALGLAAYPVVTLLYFNSDGARAAMGD